ncbi:MAG: ABC transporter ATP-binding protein [Pedosphaera sp.]|nr:ABC transporter ATP-binding protein [Pedosphaera sp.]MSU43409.1 ABC transporter ATP-binding protein [Pedosphaera sp.]
MTETQPLLHLREVTKEYAGHNGAALAVLREVTLDIRAGESVAITGPSGSGKSTLLNIMGALDQPTRGHVSLGGEDLATFSRDQLAHLRNRAMGFVFQSHHLLPQCTVMENVLVPTLARGRATPDAEARARRLLDRVGLSARLTHQPGELSGGERQRVAVVRALINQPQLLLADEPTGALDHATAQSLGQLLVELNREERVTLIAVTHSVELARCMGRQLHLVEGRLQQA